jgi:hypothetical protein
VALDPYRGQCGLLVGLDRLSLSQRLTWDCAGTTTYFLIAVISPESAVITPAIAAMRATTSV